MTGPTINTHTEPGILHAARGASDTITTHADSALGSPVNARAGHTVGVLSLRW
jgi:hypothetical protein